MPYKDLKPCPVCKIDNYVYCIPGSYGEKVACACNVCGATTGPYDTDREAYSAWNTLVGSAEPENKPLTLEELLAISEPTPLYIQYSIPGRKDGWDIIAGHNDDYVFGDRITVTNYPTLYWIGHYGAKWIAYRQKPEEENPCMEK